MKRMLLTVMMLASTAASAETVSIPWKGDYPHNSNKHWSRDNPDDSGFSRNFKNGAPEEANAVEKDGLLQAEILVPKDVQGPIPFVLILHGCNGLEKATKAWANRTAAALNTEGIGALILDSFSSRSVETTCGMPDTHWARRRADDSFSALDYLIEKKLAKPDQVYVLGDSNGGLTTLVSMTKKEEDHSHHFAAGFPIVPACLKAVRYNDYYNPVIVFVGADDDANDPKLCIEMQKKKRRVPMQVIEYLGANHGFVIKAKPQVIKGWTDTHGVAHVWHLDYNPVAESDMLKTVISAIKTNKFGRGVDVRPTRVEETRQ